MFCMIKICSENKLNIETKLHAFDIYVSSVLNYRFEVGWFGTAKDKKRYFSNFERELHILKTVHQSLSYSPNWKGYLCIL